MKNGWCGFAYNDIAQRMFAYMYDIRLKSLKCITIPKLLYTTEAKSTDSTDRNKIDSK